MDDRAFRDDKRQHHSTPPQRDNRRSQDFPGETEEAIALAVAERLPQLDLSDHDLEEVLELIVRLNRSELYQDLADRLRTQRSGPIDRLYQALAVLNQAGQLSRDPELGQLWIELRQELDQASGEMVELLQGVLETEEGLTLALHWLDSLPEPEQCEVLADRDLLPIDNPGTLRLLSLISRCDRTALVEVVSSQLDQVPFLSVVHANDISDQDSVDIWLVTGIDSTHRARVVLATPRSSNQPRSACSITLEARESGMTLLNLESIPIAEQGHTFSGDRSEVIEAILGQTDADWNLEVPRPWVRPLLNQIQACPRISPQPLAWLVWLERWLVSEGEQTSLRSLESRLTSAEHWQDQGESFPQLDRLARSLLVCWPASLDRSELTRTIARSIRLQHPSEPAIFDPELERGSFRYLLEHQFALAIPRLVVELRWMAQFWAIAGQEEWARAALRFAQQLYDPGNHVPTHPFLAAWIQLSLESIDLESSHAGIGDQTFPFA